MKKNKDTRSTEMVVVVVGFSKRRSKMFLAFHFSERFLTRGRSIANFYIFVNAFRGVMFRKKIHPTDKHLFPRGAGMVN